MSGARLYFDTSALLPYYREEPASQRVQNFLLNLPPPLLISDLVRVEMASAVARWKRMEEIDEAQAHLLEKTLTQDFRSGLFVIAPLTAVHFQQAEKWLFAREAALRSLDALHLSCCANLRARLITCDHIMHHAAKALGIESDFLSPE